MNIKQIHGAPYYPQSQGQVESLNKRVRSTLKHCLLYFSPEDQANAWPFLLPEVAQVLNNTWSISLKCTPFKVFFGRESRLFQAGSVPVNIMPSDSYLSLMADNGEYQQSDSNCTFYHDKMTSLFHLQESRYKRSMDIRESTEQKYYKTYIKKFPITQFKIGDKCHLSKPPTVWYDTNSKCSGKVTEELHASITE